MSDNSRPITLVTGARKGIGRYLAEHYLSRGHRVIGCSRQEASIDAADYEHVIADVSDEGQVGSLFAHVRSKYGYLDNLVNNAGIASMNHSLLTPYATANRIVQTNFLGTFLCGREAAKLMKRNRYGRIVNFSTVAHPLKLEGEAIYAASKAAVQSLTEIMARELADFGITVNTIGPTPIDTDLTRAVPAEKMKALLARQAVRRYGTFQDVSNVTDFFLAQDSAFITGQTIFLGGV